MARTIPSFAWYPVIHISFSWQAQPKMNLCQISIFSQLLFFPGYLRISDCVCWTDWQNGWCFELCIQFLAFFWSVNQDSHWAHCPHLGAQWRPGKTDLVHLRQVQDICWQRCGDAGQSTAQSTQLGRRGKPNCMLLADSVESLRIGR